MMHALTEEDRERYKRQMTLEGFGEECQVKLMNSSAFVTRAGGLGGPVALYLAMAGIGKLVIAHGGRTTWSNLNRMLLQTHDSVGRPRIEKIGESLRRLNPHVELMLVGEDANADNVNDLVAQADVICDCSPMFEERYLLNEAAVAQRKPMVEAAMDGMQAYLTVLVPGETGCLRCLWPEQSSEWDGTAFPVIGGVPGATGCLASLEAIKVLTGCGAPLKGEMLLMDVGIHSYRKVKVHRRAECPVCGYL